MWQICLFKALSFSVNNTPQKNIIKRNNERWKWWGVGEADKRFIGVFSPKSNPRIEHWAGRTQQQKNNKFSLYHSMEEVKWIYCRFSIPFRLCAALWFIGWKLFVFILSQGFFSFLVRLRSFCARANPIKSNSFFLCAVIKIMNVLKNELLLGVKR